MSRVSNTVYTNTSQKQGTEAQRLCDYAVTWIAIALVVEVNWDAIEWRDGLRSVLPR